jgi:hypothetical protein
VARTSIRQLVAQRQLRSRAWREPYAEEQGKRVLLIAPSGGRVHLGCGDRYLDGYLNVDFPPAGGVASGTSHPDLAADIRHVHCPAEALKEIRLHHVFEHFERAAALALLVRWHDWLSPGGSLVIETPDFERCIEGFQARSFAEQSLILRHIFGSQEALWAEHLDGWSATRFRHVLSRLGYVDVKTRETTSDPAGLLINVIVTARKAPASRDERSEAALDLLRLSMNGTNATEERIAERWSETFTRMVGVDGQDA